MNVRRLVRVLVWSIAAFLVFHASAAIAAEYWPMDTNRTYYYATSDGDSATVKIIGATRYITYSRNGSFVCERARTFDTAADGSVQFSTDTQYCAGAIDPDYIWTYTPPITLLDYPLVVGKMWQPIATATGYGTQQVMFLYTVTAERTVTVPFGTFAVVVIEEFSLDTFRTTEYQLNREYGPVVIGGMYELVDIDYTVSTESSSWGDMKARYR